MLYLNIEISENGLIYAKCLLYWSIVDSGFALKISNVINGCKNQHIYFNLICGDQNKIWWYVWNSKYLCDRAPFEYKLPFKYGN